MTEPMTKEQQAEILAELAVLYGQKAQKATDPIDQASLIAFGQSVIWAFLESDMLSIAPEQQTEKVKQNFIDIVLKNVRKCLSEISASWDEVPTQLLLEAFGKDLQEEYILDILTQVQMKMLNPGTTLH